MYLLTLIQRRVPLKLTSMTLLEYQQAIYAGKLCPYCKDSTLFVSRSEIYSRPEHGMIYLCRPCQAWVSVHKGTDKAMGRLANWQLRNWKKEAHKWFDPIAKSGLINKIWPKHLKKTPRRKKAYIWLARQMSKDFKFTHIGMFDIEDCKEVVQICKPLVEQLAPRADLHKLTRKLSRRWHTK
jgi:hypothetical protein